METVTTKRVALVTGGNQGVGLATVKQLCEQFDGDVILTARNAERGMEAIASLQALGLNPIFHHLDVTDKASIETVRDFLTDKYGGLDVLINNAAISHTSSHALLLNRKHPHMGDSLWTGVLRITGRQKLLQLKNCPNGNLAPPHVLKHQCGQARPDMPFLKQTDILFNTNFFGIINVCDLLFPILKPHARVVNVSSLGAHVAYLRSSDAVRKRVLDPAMDMKMLLGLVDEYITLAREERVEGSGWPVYPYGVTKIGVSILTELYQRQFDSDPRHIIINSCCPGRCVTYLSAGKGSKTPDQGAEVAVHLALLPQHVDKPKAIYMADFEIIPWYTNYTNAT